MLTDPNNWAMLAALGVSIATLKAIFSSKDNLEDMSPDEVIAYIKAVNDADAKRKGSSSPKIPPYDEADSSVPVSVSDDKRRRQELERLKRKLRGEEEQTSTSQDDLDFEI